MAQNQVHRSGFPIPRGVLVAAIVAAVFLLATGAAHRAALALLDAEAAERITFDEVKLANLPLEFGTWKGQDDPLEESIVKATDTDDYVNRSYREMGSNQSVHLFVAFGTRMRDMVPHRPQVCYPGAGWNHVVTHHRRIQPPEGPAIPCQIHRFEKGTFYHTEVLVLNYYVLNGKYLPDVEKLRRRVTLFGRGRNYVAQVQITAGLNSLLENPDEKERVLLEFAAITAKAIRAQLPAELEPGGA